MLATEIPGAVIVSAGSVLITGIVGALSYMNTRQTARGASTKDITEASAIARKDLVEEVARLAHLADVHETRLTEMARSHAEQLTALAIQHGREIAEVRARAQVDREQCDQALAVLRVERDAELAWGARLIVALREAGISVPERPGGTA